MRSDEDKFKGRTLVGIPVTDEELLKRIARANEPVKPHPNNPQLRATLFHIMRRAFVSYYNYKNPLDLEAAAKEIQKLYGPGMVDAVQGDVAEYFKKNGGKLAQ